MLMITIKCPSGDEDITNVWGRMRPSRYRHNLGKSIVVLPKLKVGLKYLVESESVPFTSGRFSVNCSKFAIFQQLFRLKENENDENVLVIGAAIY